MFVETNPGYKYRKIQVPFGAFGYCSHFSTNGSTLCTNLPPYNSTSSLTSQSHSSGISLLQNQLNTQNNLPQNIYPNLNQNAPFSYIQPVYYRRSISDYMKRVKFMNFEST